MRINRSLLNWGVFLIALGGIPLAVDQGWIQSDIASDLGRLWPLILVGIGLGLILRWTPLAWFGGAVVAATFGVIFGAAIVSLPEDDLTNVHALIPAIAGGACSGGDAGPGSTRDGGLANDTAFALEATLSCGELRVARAADSSWSFAAAHGSEDQPRIDDSDRDGATAQLILSQGGNDELMFLGGQEQSDWQVAVPAEAALTMATTLNAAKGVLDLGSGPVTRVDGTFNASDVALDLAEATTLERATMRLTFNASDGELSLPAGNFDIEAALNVSALTICVPSDAALRVESSSLLSSDDLRASGLEEADPSLWTTPGFSTAGDHIDLSIDSVASSLSVERPEVCS